MEIEVIETIPHGLVEYDYHGVELLIPDWAKWIAADAIEGSPELHLWVFDSEPVFVSDSHWWARRYAGPAGRCRMVAVIVADIVAAESLEKIDETKTSCVTGIAN